MRPSHTQSECQVLADVFLGRVTFSELHELAQADFFDETNRAIFTIMQRLNHSGKEWDGMDVFQEAATQEQRAAIGQMMAWPMSGVKTQGHIDKIRDAAQRRAFIDLCNKYAIAAVGGDAQTVISEAQAAMFNLLSSKTRGGLVPIQEIAADWIDEIDRRRELPERYGIMSGFPTIDDITGGFEPGELIILGGRPGSGKTTLAMNIMQNVAKKGKEAIAVFSMEMTSYSLMNRLAAAIARISMKRLREPKDLQDGDFPLMAQAIEWVNDATLHIDEEPALHHREILARARACKQRHGLRLVMVDYLGLANSDSKTPYESATEISGAMKAMAKELEVPVILISQLNREVDKRKPPRPVMSDLRDSGAVEQDADKVIFVYRPGAYQSPDDEPDNSAEIIVAKNRSGMAGTAMLMWQGEYNKFIEPDYRF